jgi:hypothetical protein
MVADGGNAGFEAADFVGNSLDSARIVVNGRSDDFQC